MDVNLSSDDDDVPMPKPNVSDDQKASAGDDAGDDGATSVEPTAPNPIRFGVPESYKPSAVDQAIVPPTSRRGRKCPPPATK
jgi:hypothetical protein